MGPLEIVPNYFHLSSSVQKMPFRKRFKVELRQDPDYLALALKRFHVELKQDSDYLPLALKRLLLQLSLQCAQL